MNCNRFGTTLLLALATLTIPLAAVASPRTHALTPIAQAQVAPTNREVLNTCVQSRAETLPNPFVDVPPNHWALKAILTMHYCGVYRQATPSSLIERLTNPLPTQPTPPTP